MRTKVRLGCWPCFVKSNVIFEPFICYVCQMGEKSKGTLMCDNFSLFCVTGDGLNVHSLFCSLVTLSVKSVHKTCDASNLRHQHGKGNFGVIALLENLVLLFWHIHCTWWYNFHIICFWRFANWFKSCFTS